MFGLSVQRYVRLSRMKRAAVALACRPEMPMTEVALAAGFGSSDSFARAFREEFGMAPSAFREAPDWAAWQSAIQPHDQARKSMTETFDAGDVEIVAFDEVPVLTMSHRGDPATLNATIGRFIAWRKERRLGPQRTRTFNLFHGDPLGDPAAFRLDLAGSRPPGVAADEEVEEGFIPGGRCARLTLAGRGDDLEGPANWLYREWLPESGETLRDFPLFCERSNFGPGIPESGMVTQLYLPLA